jgi:hypothetical protein
MPENFLEFNFDTTVAHALEQIQSKNVHYCVVCDEQGWPAVLASSADLERASKQGFTRILDPGAGMPPAILAPDNIPASQLAAHPSVTLLEFGARGAILMSGRSVTSVLPASKILASLAGGALPPAGRTMGISLGDIQLGGVLGTPVGRFVCRECGYLNELSYLDEENLADCQNPSPPLHKLRLR